MKSRVLTSSFQSLPLKPAHASNCFMIKKPPLKLLLTPPVRGPIMCRITRNRINVFFFDSRRCCTSTCRRLCLNLWSDIIISYPLKSYKRTNAFLCTFFNTSGGQPGSIFYSVRLHRLKILLSKSSYCSAQHFSKRSIFSGQYSISFEKRRTNSMRSCCV